MRKPPVFLVFTLAVFLSACGQGPQGPKGDQGPPVLRVRKAIRGRLALLEWRGPKASKVSPAPKGRKGSKDLLVRKALKENRDRPARPGQVCAS